MSYKDTNNYYDELGGMHYCSYCHKPLYGYDVMYEDGGGYWGQYFQCDCKQAKIEEQMNDEIEIVEKKSEDKINEIKSKYTNKLKIDYHKRNEMLYQCAIMEAKMKYEEAESYNKL